MSYVENEIIIHRLRWIELNLFCSIDELSSSELLKVFQGL
jgi:hypothetical protein